MFRDSNIILFLYCIIPAIAYALVIFLRAPTLSIRLKASFSYLFIGLLSITILSFIQFIFPHLDDTFFEYYEGSFVFKNHIYNIYQPTLASLLLFAFVQVGLMEETSKWLALKTADYMRGKRRKNLDHPYAIMFYAALISAGFAIVENMHYAHKAVVGDFGDITPESLLRTRAFSSVIIHMACGLLMGYYIALSKGATKIKKVFYNIIGILTAAFIHGMYDFNCMVPDVDKHYYKIFGTLPIHVPSAIIIGFCLIIGFFMSWHLKYIQSQEPKKLQ